MLRSCVAAATLLSAGACAHPPARGLYTALKFTYYPGSLEVEGAGLRAHELDVVYPELGVFDPERKTFSDFSRSFEVRLEAKDEGPEPFFAALESLPRRVRSTVGDRAAVIPWVFLMRAVAGSLEGATVGDEEDTMAFDPANPAHRRAVVEMAVRLEALGFDGVQLDLEPFLPTDVPYLEEILEAIGLEAGPDFVRAIFCPKYVKDPLPPVNPGYVWSRVRPYARLLRHCEQLLIPLYDYGHLVKDEAQYRRRAREVARRFSGRAGRGRRVWLALPSYRRTPNHGPEESLSNAFQAIREDRGLPGGVAVFVFTGDERDFPSRGDVHWPE